MLPLFKKDDPENLINYRPISLTGALAKIFEILLQDQMLAYLEKNKLLATTQFGFRRKCQLHMLFYFALKKWDMISIKKHRYRSFLDLPKAFDSTAHPFLLHKNKLLSFCAQANTILKSYLENRVQKIKFSKYESKWIALNLGVPQGTVLVPMLFNIQINDMKDDTEVNFNIIQYADYTFIFCCGKTNFWIKITFWKKYC